MGERVTLCAFCAIHVYVLLSACSSVWCCLEVLVLATCCTLEWLLKASRRLTENKRKEKIKEKSPAGEKNALCQCLGIWYVNSAAELGEAD